MKNHNENEGLQVAIFAFFLFVAMTVFIFHLLSRHNALYSKYSGCMDALRLYGNAWEQGR